MKRLLLALSAVGLGLLTVAPAFAQTSGGQYGKGEAVMVTGVLQKQGITSYQYGTHFMKDVGSGTGYALKSSKVDLNGYVGKRVTVYGTLAMKAGELEGGPALLDVSRVVPVSPPGGGSTNVEPGGPGGPVSGSENGGTGSSGTGDSGSNTGTGNVGDVGGSSSDGGGTGVLPNTGGLPLSIVAGAALLALGFLIRHTTK